MIFDDVFYPGNPRRRQEVANLRGEIIALFNGYQAAWNKNADLLNDIFYKSASGTPFQAIRIAYIQKNITKDTVNDCLAEMKAVIDDTQTKLNKLVEDIGVSKLLPSNWEKGGVKIEDLGKDTLLKIGKAFTAVLSTTGAGFLGYYVFVSVSFAVTWGGFVSGAISSIAATLSGVLGGIIAGGVAFILTDMIASAITGAIERKELNEAIDALTELKRAIKDPLTNGINAISGISQNIKDGNYKLGNGWYLGKDDEGNYIIYTLGTGGKIVKLDFIKAA
ncbi:MAG TPA: hypothetical protein H9667_02400 [Firmicutes bacterium]|nr:hypothetical protein [Bacillota bacterium]